MSAFFRLELFMKILIFDVKGDTLYLHDDSVPVQLFYHYNRKR
jgi:hypothetical protein